MEQSYLHIDPHIYALLREKIQAAFEELLAKDKGHPPPLSTLSIHLYSLACDNLLILRDTIVDYFTATDRLPHAFVLLICMKVSGILPNEHTYLTSRVFLLSPIFSLVFDLHRYRSIINGCLRYEDVDEAMIAFDMMR